MEASHYSIQLDKTGFPLIDRDGWSFAIGLFPVSKYQLERFLLAQGNTYTDEWYRKLLEINPRCSWSDWSNAPWELFVTGLDDEVRNDFLRWLGTGYRLATSEEWLTFLQVSDELHEPDLKADLIHALHGAAKPALHWISKDIYPLTQSGILEQVSHYGKIRCLGRPWWPKPAFFSNTWSPDTLRDVNESLSRRLVGFRIVADLDSWRSIPRNKQ